jgi:hypothetical protein
MEFPTVTTTDIVAMDLKALNSATKYPSIPTYHGLDPKNGGLIEEQPTVFPGPVLATEKIDGTNSRMIFVGDDWFIGSREELLTAKGDRVINPALGIVESLRDVTARIAGSVEPDPGSVITLYVELYGLRTLPAWKTYGDGKTAGWRLFDVSVAPVERLAEPIGAIASWREHGGQRFLAEDDLQAASRRYGLELTPRLEVPDGLPTGLAPMRALLEALAPRTRVALDAQAAVAKLPEGVVFRSPDRAVIAKARVEDYDRTLRRRAGGR